MLAPVFTVLFALAVAWSPLDQFEEFKNKFGRNYSAEEEASRRQIFMQNLALIEKENSKGKSYTLGVTHFADMTRDEWRSQYLTGLRPAARKNASRSVFRTPLSFSEVEAVDWVAQGAVTPVKNQARCGSCWAFSTTGALEGASVVAGRPLVSLSEQNILDCETDCNKCHGGRPDLAFEWVQSNGLLSEDDDSYLCADMDSAACASSTCPTSGSQVLKPGDVTEITQVDANEGALEAAVAQQPVSIAIEADQDVFMHYTGGVITGDACGTQLDHAVLIVGYGNDAGQKYWKVKNSWGSSWGEDGYVRIEKGLATDGGECGVREMAFFPTVQAKASTEVLV